MSTREALAAALKYNDEMGWTHRLVTDAARERLAQLRIVCPICGDNSGPATDTSCDRCADGSRSVYPPALVERIAETLKNAWKIDYQSMAVAVLDDLNEGTKSVSDVEPVVMHHGELTDEETRVLAKATIAKIKENQRTEVIELRELLADIVQKAHPYGVQDGDFIASYLLATGPIHRAIKYLNERGISTVAVLDALNDWKPE